MRFLVLTACLGLCACAGMMPPAPIYYRQNATDEELQRDLAGCRMQMAMVPQQPTDDSDSTGPDAVFRAAEDAATTQINRLNKEAFFADCMRSKGWVRPN